jgi:Bacterial CdiA-CT RNAse A domain
LRAKRCLQTAAVSPTGGSAGLPARSASIEHALDTKFDVLLVDSVRSGKVKIRSIANAGPTSSQLLLSAAKIQAEYIGVPDAILIARQKRTGQVTFAFHDAESLETAIDELIAGNRVMIENWARRGGQPPLYLRHQAKSPFGRIVHAGAESATDMRSVAAKASCGQAQGLPYYMIELSLSQRKA